MNEFERLSYELLVATTLPEKKTLLLRLRDILRSAKETKETLSQTP